MKVTIRLDAFEDEQLLGEVVKVNEYPEPGSWFSSQVKEYATFVTIYEPPPQLRPGLTAEVRIHVAQRDDALQVPVQTIHEHGDKLYCMLRHGDRWKAQPVQIEASNDKYVLVASGIDEDDQVAMNPRALLDRVSLPKLADKPARAATSADTRDEVASPAAESPVASPVRLVRRPLDASPGANASSPSGPGASRAMASATETTRDAGNAKIGSRATAAVTGAPATRQPSQENTTSGRSP
jgi:hypothetical protein